MEIPTESHKTAPVSYVTPATMLSCAAEADGHAGERRKQLFLLGESSFLSSLMSCPSKSVPRKGTTSRLSPTGTSEAAEASTL